MPRQDIGLSASTPNTVFDFDMLLWTIGIIFGFFPPSTYERLLADLQKLTTLWPQKLSNGSTWRSVWLRPGIWNPLDAWPGGVAHFFNNKLCVMNGYAALLRESRESTPPVRSMSGFIEEAGKQMAGMTDRLLAFSRSKMLRSASVDLPQWLRGMEPQIRGVFPECVDVRIETPSAPAVVFVEADELSLVILRIAKNASEAIPRDGSFLACLRLVDVTSSQCVIEPGIPVGSYACLSLTDTGIGMDAETRQRVFEPFFSTKGPASSEGLGLASAFGFVTQSGGTIAVRSEPGKGTTFDVYLPLKDAQSPSSLP